MKIAILYFLLLILEIALNLSPNAGYKQGIFFKTLLEKDLELILNETGSAIMFDLSLVLLFAEIDLVTKKQSCKKHAFRLCSISRIEIILALPTKEITLYM